MDYIFPCCNEWHEVDHDLYENVTCPKCHIKYKTEYEESWDGEEEQQFYWLGERVDASTSDAGGEE